MDVYRTFCPKPHRNENNMSLTYNSFCTYLENDQFVTDKKRYNEQRGDWWQEQKAHRTPLFVKLEEQANRMNGARRKEDLTEEELSIKKKQLKDWFVAAVSTLITPIMLPSGWIQISMSHFREPGVSYLFIVIVTSHQTSGPLHQQPSELIPY